MQPIKKIALGGSRKIQEIHHLGNDCPRGMAAQLRAMRAKKFDGVGVMVVAAVVQRSQRPAVSQYV